MHSLPWLYVLRLAWWAELSVAVMAHGATYVPFRIERFALWVASGFVREDNGYQPLWWCSWKLDGKSLVATLWDAGKKVSPLLIFGGLLRLQRMPLQV